MHFLIMLILFDLFGDLFLMNNLNGVLILLKNRKLYIIDARPRANALANGAKGGGSESSSNYPRSEVMLDVIVI